MLGNGRLEATCIDGLKRLCHIRGKMRKKVWVNTVRPYSDALCGGVDQMICSSAATRCSWRTRCLVRRETSSWSDCETTRMRRLMSSSSEDASGSDTHASILTLGPC